MDTLQFKNKFGSAVDTLAEDCDPGIGFMTIFWRSLLSSYVHWTPAMRESFYLPRRWASVHVIGFCTLRNSLLRKINLKIHASKPTIYFTLDLFFSQNNRQIPNFYTVIDQLHLLDVGLFWTHVVYRNTHVILKKNTAWFLWLCVFCHCWGDVCESLWVLTVCLIVTWVQDLCYFAWKRTIDNAAE